MQGQMYGKKFISILLCVLMTLSVLPVMPAVTADAAAAGTVDVVVFAQDKTNNNTGYFSDVAKYPTTGALTAVCYWNNTHAPYYFDADAENLTELENQCKLGKIKIAYGSADGKTWSEPQELITPQKLCEWGIGVWVSTDGKTIYYDQASATAAGAIPATEARDPGIVAMKDGTLLLTFFTRMPAGTTMHGVTTSTTDAGTYYGGGFAYIMYSTDDGKNWSKPQLIESDFFTKTTAKRGTIACYEDGHILIPLYAMAYNGDTAIDYAVSSIYAKIGDVDNNGDGYNDFVWEAEYADDTEVTGDVTNAANGAVGERLGAFAKGATEAAYGVTTVDGQEVTYALYRPAGDFLVSYDKGQSWTVLGRDVEYGGAFNNPVRLQQPTFSRISVNNKDNDKGELFVTWSGTGVNGGRSVFGKIYTPGEDWNDTNYTLLYENPAGYDMADPTGIELANGELFTLVYDVTAGYVGGVFHNYADVKAGYSYNAAQALPADILTEDFEGYGVTADGTYNSSNPYTTLSYGSSVARSATRIDANNNQYLEMAPSASATAEGSTLGWNYFSPIPRVSGDATVQFDFKFNDSAAATQQMLRMYFAASEYGGYDPFYITLLQNDGTGDVNRLTINYNDKLKKSVDNAFTAGEYHTMKIHRQGEVVYIKVWKKGTTEPDAFTLVHKFASLKTNGYPGFWYGSTASDMGLCIDNIQIRQTNTLTLSQNSANISEPFKLTATLNPAVDGAEIKWSSSNTAVATVSSDGTVTPVAPGSAVITASYNNVIDTCSILIDSVHDELAGTKSELKFIDEDFDDIEGTTYSYTDIWTKHEFGNTIVTENDGNKYLMPSTVINSYPRSNIYVGGQYTLKFDFKMEHLASGTQRLGLIFRDVIAEKEGTKVSDKGYVAIEQSGGSAYVNIMNGGGTTVPAYYNGSTTETTQKYTGCYTPGDGNWYTVKLTKIGDTLYIKLWKRTEAEPGGYLFKAKNATFNCNGLQFQYNRTVNTPICIDNVSLSKHVDFSIVDDGSTALKAAFDRDISAESPTPTVAWSSSDATVATVDGGTLTYLKEGATKITASSYNLTDSVDVKVAKLTYNMNGHGTQIEPQLFRGGTTLTAPTDPTEDGYVFMGWYTDASFTAKFDFASPGSESVTLYARWATDTPTNGTPYGGTAPVIAAEGTTTINAAEKNVDAIGSGGTVYNGDGYYDIRGKVAGEWWTYTVNAAKAGYYKLAVLGSGGYHEANGRFTLAINGNTIVDGTGENTVILPRNGDYPWVSTDPVKAWYYFDDTDKTDIGIVYLSEGEHVIKVTVDVVGKEYGTLFKKFYFTPATDAELAGTPYGGTAPEIKAYGMTVINAAEKNTGAADDGGSVVNYDVYYEIRSTVAGDSWVYTINVPKAGKYNLEVLGSSGYAMSGEDVPGRFSLSIDGTKVTDGTGENPVMMPANGEQTDLSGTNKQLHLIGDDDRVTIGTVDLTEGEHVIKVTVDVPGNTYGIIFKKFYLTSVDRFKAVSHTVADGKAAFTIQGKASGDKMKAILAEYGEGGKLVKARTQDIALTDATEFTKTFDISESGVTSRRLFIFDIAKLIPGLSTPYDVN